MTPPSPTGHVIEVAYVTYVKQVTIVSNDAVGRFTFKL